MKLFKLLFYFFIWLLPHYLMEAQISQKLPDWFFASENYNRINLAIGISEPDNDTIQALEQAKINALINYSLLHDAVFTSLTNVGIGQQENIDNGNTSIEYILYSSIIKGKLPKVSSITVKEKFFTRYKEAIVLLEINNEENQDSIFPQFTITRRAGFQKEDFSYPLFVDEMDIEVLLNDSISLHSGIIKEGSKFLNADNDAKDLYYNEYTNKKVSFMYAGSLGYLKNNKVNHATSTPLNYGLWKSYIFNLTDQISIRNGMDINMQFKLTTANIGNLQHREQSLNFQQLVYSLKNIQAIKLNNYIEQMELLDNYLSLSLKTNNPEYDGLHAPAPGKADKKLLKKMKAENWEFIGNESFETAWLKSLQISKDKGQFLNAEIDIQANNLHSGILEGIQLGKLQLSSQLATKVNALNNSNIVKDEQLLVKSAKLINVEKTGKIGPYFIFYQNVAPNVFNIKMILLYDSQQLNN